MQSKKFVLRRKMPDQNDVFYLRMDECTVAYCSFQSTSLGSRVGRSWQIKQSPVFQVFPEDPAYYRIFERLYLLPASETFQRLAGVKYISIDSFVNAAKLSTECGPVHLGMIHRFCSMLESELALTSKTPVALIASPDGPLLTNAVLLLGAYMLSKHATLERVVSCFQFATEVCGAYRAGSDDDLELPLADCWAALKRSMDHGWFSATAIDSDPAEHERRSTPPSPDLHAIIPGKLIALRGPSHLPASAHCEDTARGGDLLHRDLSPPHCAEVLKPLDVRAVVRLGGPAFSPAALLGAGIAAADLAFDDAACPPPDVVAKFMLIAEGVRGAVAVHCDDGRGRTGTLIALYLMKRHGFTARQAIAWLRMVRPGSVAGGPARYLLAREAVMQRVGGEREAAGAAEAAGLDDVTRLIEGAEAAVDRRMAGLSRRRVGGGAPSSGRSE